MNILVLNPPGDNIIQEFPDPDGVGHSGIEIEDYGSFPPLGALYILTYAQKMHPEHNYYFIDCVGEKISYGQLEARIKEIKPDLVGITSFTISLVDVLLAARLVKKNFPDAHITLGGHHPTAFPFEAAELKEFDSIVVGEGEYAFSDLIAAVNSKLDFTHILGVYTKKSLEAWRDKQFKDPRFLNHLIVPPAYVNNVNDIPFPDRRYIEHINYNSVIGVSGKLATLITSRGCPYKCTFCDVPYKKYRELDLDKVMDEIEDCLALGYEEFHFYDDLFNMTTQKVIDFCNALKRRNLNIIWNFRGRVNDVDFESLKLARDTGCRMISFGVETGSDEGLRTLRKGTRTEQIKKVYAWCRQLGIKTMANFMIGLPHEKTPEDVINNIRFLISLDSDYALINIMNLYPHTQVYTEAEKKGLLTHGDWEEFCRNPSKDFKVSHWTEFLTERQLVDLHKRAYRMFYFRPSYVVRSIFNTQSGHELKSKLHGFRKLVMNSR